MRLRVATCSVLGAAVLGASAVEPAAAAARTCTSGRAQVLAQRALAAARARYHHEDRGVAAHMALGRIARDRALLADLTSGNTAAARRRMKRLLIGHVVRIRLVRNGSVVVEANPTSFAVGGVWAELVYRGRDFGLLEVTIQDVIGYIKLVRKYGHADVVVRGASGRVRTSLRSVPGGLPSTGCVTTSGRTFVVRSFAARGFAGEALRIWVLAAV